LTRSFRNSVSLLLVISFNTPYLQTISECRNLTTVCTLASSVTIALVYFVKKSMVRMMYLFPVNETSKGSIISILIYKNGFTLIVTDNTFDIFLFLTYF